MTSIFHESGHQIGHQIGLSFSYKKSSKEFIPAIYPFLKLGIPLGKSGLQIKKISIYESKFDPSGLGCVTKEGTYDINQITESFVKEKLSSFFKALFTKE